LEIRINPPKLSRKSNLEIASKKIRRKIKMLNVLAAIYFEIANIIIVTTKTIIEFII